VASFNGNSLMFGPASTLVTAINPRAAQRFGAAGVDGEARQDQGFRGMKTHATGILYTGAAGTAADLNLLRLIWWSYYDGRPYVLIDNYGQGFPDVLLERIDFEKKVKRDAFHGFFLNYDAEFYHLSPPF
jgi:hypothetical protein